jgi:hypothetical protein
MPLSLNHAGKGKVVGQPYRLITFSCCAAKEKAALVSRFGSSPEFSACSEANFPEVREGGC